MFTRKVPCANLISEVYLENTCDRAAINLIENLKELHQYVKPSPISDGEKLLVQRKFDASNDKGFRVNVLTQLITTGE